MLFTFRTLSGEWDDQARAEAKAAIAAFNAGAGGRRRRRDGGDRPRAEVRATDLERPSAF